MKLATASGFNVCSPLNLVRSAALLALALGVSSLGPSLYAQISDDFSDGDDTANPTWTHLSGEANSTGQSWTVSGGQYRLQAPNNGVSGYGFAGSYIATSFSAVNVKADFVNFGGPGTNPVFAVGARLNGANTLVGLTGYAYVYEPFAAGLTGEMVLYRIDAGGLGVDIGSQMVSLDPSKDYTFSLTIDGSNLHGQVFEVGGPMVAERFAVDSAYASGFSGVFGFGRAGVTLPTDFTIDNFETSVVPEPATATLMIAGFLGLLARRLRRK